MDEAYKAVFAQARDADSSTAGFLVDEGWNVVKVKPEVIEVHANGTNGNRHHDEVTDPQQTLFYR